MGRGRKPDEGTLEAKELVIKGGLEEMLLNANVKEVVLKRVMKAVKFGLGIKESVVEEIEVPGMDTTPSEE